MRVDYRDDLLGRTGTYYDGTEYGKHTTSAGFTATKKVTCSYWIKRTRTTTIEALASICVNTTGGAMMFSARIFSSSDQVWFSGYRASDATIVLNVVSGAGSGISHTNWHHVLFSCDLSDTSKRWLYLDDVLTTPTWLTYVNDNMAPIISVPTETTTIGADFLTAINSPFIGSLSELYIDMGTYTDFSVTANRRKFITEDGNPANLGLTGERPTGSQPEIYLPGGNGTVQRGSTSAYTNTGTPDTVAGPNP